jgi:radical SAM superfamily enzyme YgiQ (UPF0313 family)
MIDKQIKYHHFIAANGGIHWKIRQENRFSPCLISSAVKIAEAATIERITMHYEGNIICPSSEANSILLQVTVGCSHNKCTFCGTFTGERFKIKSDDIIMQDIAFAAT